MNDATSSRKSNTIVITRAAAAVAYSDYIQHRILPTFSWSVAHETRVVARVAITPCNCSTKDAV